LINQTASVATVRELPELCSCAADVRSVDFALEGDGGDEQQRSRARYRVHDLDQGPRLRFIACEPNFETGDGEAGLDRDPVTEGGVACISGGAGLEAVGNNRSNALV
jgi:hypothetical protein